jgi:transcriptional regulator with XRE-family HTH domain
MALEPENLCLRAQEKVHSLIPRLNVSDTAKKAGVDVSKFHKWLKGESGLDYQELFAVCQVLKASVDWVLDDNQVTPGMEKYKGKPVRDLRPKIDMKLKKTVERGSSNRKRDTVDE